MRRRRDPGERAGAAGFTLVELMVVLVIIGLIALVGVPNLVRAKVRAEMLGQVKMMQQAFAVARMNAIKGGRPVALELENIGGNQALVAWDDANGNQSLDSDERVVGRWSFRSTHTVWEDPAMRFFRLGGTTPGMMFMPTGSALVALGGTIGSGQAGAIVGDIKGNQMRIRVLGGTGTVVHEMRNPANGSWDATSTKYWRY